jgi:predicted HicB family RNase H-like nuclease
VIVLTYKGYVGRIDLDDEARTFWGTVLNARVLVSFRGSDIDELEKSFHDVVDTLLDDCRRTGKAPQRAFSGKITIRLSPELHRRVALKSALCKQSMNEYMRSLLVRETQDLPVEGG